MRPTPLPSRLLLAAAIACVAGTGHPVAITAQEVLAPARGGRTESLGLPPRARPHFMVAAGRYGRGDVADPQFTFGLGLYKDLVNPVMSLVGVLVDGYGSVRTGGIWDGGLQAQIHSPLFRLAGGLDYSIRDREADFMLSVLHPLQRGGVVFDGGMLRASWLPGRGHSFQIGLQAPFGVPRPGTSRPLRSAVRVEEIDGRPIPIPTSVAVLQPALDRVVELGARIDALLVPYLDEGGSTHEEGLERLSAKFEELQVELAGSPGAPADALSAEEVVRAFHDAAQTAFAVALDPASPDHGPDSERLAAAARRALMDELLIPHNALLGQFRDVDTMEPFAARARGEFVRLMDRGGILDDTQRWRAEWVFNQLVSTLEELRARKAELWGDARMVWMPFQFALLPEDYDEQEEIDRIVERVAAARFRAGNDVDYILNERFQYAVLRSIREAEEYHVLWVHDVRGRTPDGDPDRVAFDQIVDGYLPTLTRRIEDYDETGILPEFHIFLDQWFYEVNGGRLYLEFLQDPLERTIDFPEGFESWGEELARARTALAAAVASSRRLQSEAQAYGDEWLRNRVKVHVHITNQPDPTFWSGQILPLVGMPDNILRDHRKIVLWDVTEADPTRGGMMLTGMGVGEHYTGTHWEDRAVQLRGPAALEGKAAARDHLLDQGLELAEIPWVLQPREMPPEAFDARVVADVVDVRAAQLHNAVGFGRKQVTAAKATLYSLLSPGSVLKVPDSLWNHPLWASLMVGSALRGARVLIISPALANAPAAGWPQMSRAYELMSRLVLLQNQLAPNLDAVGGLLRVGIYSPSVGVGEIPARLDRYLETMERESWLGELYGFHPDVADSLRAVRDRLRREGFRPRYLTDDTLDLPRLHLKIHLMASEEGWEGLFAQPEWASVLSGYFTARARQVADPLGNPTDLGDLSAERAEELLALGTRFFGEMDEERARRVQYYLLVGSHNQDYRSMLLDGEVELMISGTGAVVGIEDFLLLPGLSTWVESDAELQTLLPRPAEWRRRIARFIRVAL